MTNAQNFEFLIQERSRSVKSLFAVQQLSTKSLTHDNGATFFDTGAYGLSSAISYQYRIGGRYYPAAPVELSVSGQPQSNGGAEAYAELSKALNTVGDYRLSSPCNAKSWAMTTPNIGMQDQDFKTCLVALGLVNEPVVAPAATFEGVDNLGFCGGFPSANFCMAVNLETSAGNEVAGLNAEEQSDIALKCTYAYPQGTAGFATQMNIYSYFDGMIILRENNVIELVQ